MISKKWQGLINEKTFNIWRYAVFYPAAQEKHRLTLGEGWTREVEIEKLSEQLGLRNLFFKREDLNPNGSHKDRSIAYRISKALEEGHKKLVIPSSGNSAISAAAYCNFAGIKLYAFVPKEINKSKMARLSRLCPNCFTTNNIVEDAEEFSRKHDVENLRPSTDPFSSVGFRSIAFEVYERLGKIDALFTSVSSGASIIGIGEGFAKLRELDLIKTTPQLHIVQTEAVNPIACEFEMPIKRKEKAASIATAICSKNPPTKEKVVELVKGSKGRGWIVSDSAILNALELLKRNGINTSPEGAAAFAGLRRAKEDVKLKRVVCLLTGRAF